MIKVFQNPSLTFQKVMRFQKHADDTCYRLFAFVIKCSLDDGVLLFNTLSCEMVFVSAESVDALLSETYLIEHWFVVPVNFDDKKFARQYIGIANLLHKQRNVINGYTVLPTTDCNARCFYCYEMGRSRINMNETTALKVADYIISNYRKVPESEAAPVRFRWFGGEPLYNASAIDLICRRLSEEEVPFGSTMVSNGYLFDQDMVRKAVDDWRLKRIQITLDGTERNYNKAKAFIYKEGNPFERVIHNIGLLLDAGVHLTVRMNIDIYNADDLQDLARLLASRFEGKSGLSCYCHPLFEQAAGARSRKHTDTSRAAVYQKQLELMSLLSELHLLGGKSLPKDIPYHLCMADSGKSVIVSPAGDIGLCEHYSDSEFFSHVDSPEKKDMNTIRKFRERSEELPLCDDCAYYPQCIRLKMCEENSICFEEIRDFRIATIKEAMRNTYYRKVEPENLPSSDRSEDSDAGLSVADIAADDDSVNELENC